MNYEDNFQQMLKVQNFRYSRPQLEERNKLEKSSNLYNNPFHWRTEGLVI